MGEFDRRSYLFVSFLTRGKLARAVLEKNSQEYVRSEQGGEL